MRKSGEDWAIVDGPMVLQAQTSPADGPHSRQDLANPNQLNVVPSHGWRDCHILPECRILPPSYSTELNLSGDWSTMSIGNACLNRSDVKIIAFEPHPISMNQFNLRIEAPACPG